MKHIPLSLGTANTNPSILICDDSKGVLAGVLFTLQEHFPEYKIHAATSVDGALDLARRANGTLKLACLDGELGDRLGRMGWDLARMLRQEVGYQGPIIHSGHTHPPEEARPLYTKSVLIKDIGGHWVGQIRPYLS